MLAESKNKHDFYVFYIQKRQGAAEPPAKSQRSWLAEGQRS